MLLTTLFFFISPKLERDGCFVCSCEWDCVGYKCSQKTSHR